jgi:hypothetical protein
LTHCKTAVAQLDNPARGFGQVRVVGDEDDSEAVALIQLLKRLADLMAAG